MSPSKIQVNVSQGIATITLNEPERLNVLSPEGYGLPLCHRKVAKADLKTDYDDFANSLREIDKRDDVTATVWQANGKWFCAGTNVKRANALAAPTVREQLHARIFLNNIDCTRALSTHSKILVAALNGPVMGIAAAYLGNFDFIYALPEAWLYTGYPFLGLVTEGGASVTFANRMGLAKANEVLIFNKKKDAQELLECGFVNKIFPSQSTESFHAAVRQHLLSELDGLDSSSVLDIKALLKAGLSEKNNPDAVNLRESYAQAARGVSGIPARRFGMISRKEIKHKL